MEKGISPEEPFLYKVLEYIGLGPHTEFFIGSSTSYDSSDYLKTNFIMTTGEELHFDTPQEAKFYKDFLGSKNMDHAVEITFAALIAVLLTLGDVFDQNLRNYGITTDNRFLFIDHLPSFNGLFDFYHPPSSETYSPRKRLQHLFKDKEGKSNLFNLKSFYDEQFNNSEEREHFDEELNRRVNDRVFYGIQEKGLLSLESAINKAKEDLTNIISDKAIYFIPDALIRLQDYIEDKLIGRNLTNYKKSNYYIRYLRSKEELPKATISSQNGDKEKDTTSEEQ